MSWRRADEDTTKPSPISSVASKRPKAKSSSFALVKKWACRWATANVCCSTIVDVTGPIHVKRQAAPYVSLEVHQRQSGRGVWPPVQESVCLLDKDDDPAHNHQPNLRRTLPKTRNVLADVPTKHYGSAQNVRNNEYQNPQSTTFTLVDGVPSARFDYRFDVLYFACTRKNK